MRAMALLLAITAVSASAQIPPAADQRREFRIRQIAAGTVYLDAGSAAGLAEGMHLELTRRPPGAALTEAVTVGRVKVVSVATATALCEIESAEIPPARDDIATLLPADEQMRTILLGIEQKKPYAQTVSFTEDDPLEEELRATVPRPPLPEINRIRGRVTFDSSIIRDRTDAALTSQQLGMSIRADMTRIGGTHWNLTGYWRGRRSSSGGASETTLIDLMNRTYHLGLFYNNPESKNLFGIGRLLLPWASSLETLDGGYYGRRLTRRLTTAVFAGSTPDPTAWNYAPDRQMAGALVNYERGSFDSVHVSSTAGIAFTSIKWKPERRFLFAENTLMVGRALAIHHNMEADELKAGRFGGTKSGAVLSRSFFTLRVQPVRFLSFDVNHNYFRTIPTFDRALIGTGLLDNLLFQGLSAGVRVETPWRVQLYSQLGRNKRQDDPQAAWNYLYGATFTRLPWLRARVDGRYARVASAFGSGSYESFSLSREVADVLRLEFQAGRQNFVSALTREGATRFLGGSIDWTPGRHYVLGGGLLFYRGEVQIYDQIYFNLGYRF
jgi:hypothetical protein